MTRRPLVVLVVLACVPALVACGDDKGGSSASAEAILKDTFGQNKDVKSGRLDVKLRIDTQNVPSITQPVSIGLSGPFASTGAASLPKFDLRADLDVNGQRLSGGAVSTGEQGFLLFQGQAYEMGKELYDQFRKGYADQAKCNKSKGSGVSLSSLGVDPQRWLTGVKKVGSQDVGGVQATHLTAGVEMPALLDDVNRVLGRTDLKSDPCAGPGQPDKTAPQQLSSTERKKILDTVKSARVDLWSGDDDRILRRMNVVVKLSDGRQSGDLSFDVAIGAINAQQSIDAPKDAKPLSALTGQLGGQIPGLSGATGSSGASGSGGASASGSGSGSSGGTSSQYLDCVNGAGQDVAKLQQCADLIGK